MWSLKEKLYSLKEENVESMPLWAVFWCCRRSLSCVNTYHIISYQWGVKASLNDTVRAKTL